MYVSHKMVGKISDFITGREIINLMYVYRSNILNHSIEYHTMQNIYTNSNAKIDVAMFTNMTFIDEIFVYRSNL